MVVLKSNETCVGLKNKLYLFMTKYAYYIVMLNYVFIYSVIA